MPWHKLGRKYRNGTIYLLTDNQYNCPINMIFTKIYIEFLRYAIVINTKDNSKCVHFYYETICIVICVILINFIIAFLICIRVLNIITLSWLLFFRSFDYCNYKTYNIRAHFDHVHKTKKKIFICHYFVCI